MKELKHETLEEFSNKLTDWRINHFLAFKEDKLLKECEKLNININLQFHFGDCFYFHFEYLF